MARLLTSMETGDYFTDTGEVRQNLPIDYIKASSWELRPRVKAPLNTQTSDFILDESRTESKEPR